MFDPSEWRFHPHSLAKERMLILLVFGGGGGAEQVQTFKEAFSVRFASMDALDKRWN